MCSYIAYLDLTLKQTSEQFYDCGSMENFVHPNELQLTGHEFISFISSFSFKHAHSTGLRRISSFYLEMGRPQSLVTEEEELYYLILSVTFTKK